MKILVMSDSHGHDEYVYTILADHGNADYILHLGDGYRDLDLSLSELPILRNKPIIMVRGNCDMFSDNPVTSFDNIGGKKFYITHGYAQHVKSGVDYLYADALKNGREVALYGHTHTPYYEGRNGIHIFNPGAVMNGSYGIITLDNEGNIDFKHYSL